MVNEQKPTPAGKAEGDEPERGLEPGESGVSTPDDGAETSPGGKEFGADDHTPQQGGL